MINNLDNTIDSRGKDYLEKVFCDLDNMFGTNSHIKTIEKIKNIYFEIGIKYSNIINIKDLNQLVSSVNIERLNNNPISLDKDVLEQIYIKLI